MVDSVRDGLTVRLLMRRASKVMLDHNKVREIEEYYQQCIEDGANEYQIEASQRLSPRWKLSLAMMTVFVIMAKDFVEHCEKRVSEGATVKGKAMFVCMNRKIAYKLYKEIIKLRPEWNIPKAYDEQFVSGKLSPQKLKRLKPVEKVKLVLTRNQDDPRIIMILGTKKIVKYS